MSRDLFTFEKGFHILAENSDAGVMTLFGSTAPGGSSPTDDAEQGSTYHRTNGAIYLKDQTGTGEDKWVRQATMNDITALDFRSAALVCTGNAEPGEGGTIDFSSAHYSDDETPFMVAADHTLGDYILFGAGGTEVIYRVEDITGDVVTYTKDAAHATYPVQPLATNDLFIVGHYLPDSPGGQENQAIVQYNGTDYIKLADFDWNFATGINLSAGYTPGSGNVTSSDNVESALEKIDGNVDAVEDAVGVAQGDTNMGTYTGSLISDSQSAKQNIQQLETEAESVRTLSGTSAGANNMGAFTGTIIPDNQNTKVAIQALETDLDALQTTVGVPAEATDMGTYTGSIITDNETAKENIQELETSIENIQTATSSNAVVAETTLDSVLVDSKVACKWLVTSSLDSDPARRKSFEVFAQHNGIDGGADADDVDDTVYARIKLGSAFASVIKIDLSGAGAAQVMRLRVSSTNATSWKAVRQAINF